MTQTNTADLDLIRKTTNGDRQAFGKLVERHQSLVCSVAYSIVGDFARSEDVAQEAFLTAWTRLSELREPQKFAAWICGIARNMALMIVRRERKTQPIDADVENPSTDLPPFDQAAAREEEQLVWRSLETLPESYREPLVLYYREHHSVARVAEALELSEDAVKQRLSRGREMLREEIAATIERTLRRTAPKAAFALAVLGALPGIGATSASAATIATSTKAAASIGGTTATGLIGPLLGSGVGFAGALFGMWAADQQTRYPRERNLFRRGILPVLIAYGVVFPIPILMIVFGGWNPVRQWGPIVYSMALIGWILIFSIGSFLWFWRVTRQMHRSVAEDIVAGTVPLPRSVVQKFASNYEGRQWTSRWKLLGLPLIDVQFQGPIDPSLGLQNPMKQKFACGWLAIGDRALGLIAIGSLAVGGISFGGIAIGGLALGGIGLGLVSLSGLSLGFLSIGGMAIGWTAVGGLAVGWYAFGGGAIAWRAAKGGFALANDYAIGGATYATHANDADATRFWEQLWLVKNIEPILMKMAGVVRDYPVAYNIGLVVFIAMTIVLSQLLAYRRKPNQHAEGI